MNFNNENEKWKNEKYKCWENKKIRIDNYDTYTPLYAFSIEQHIIHNIVKWKVM